MTTATATAQPQSAELWTRLHRWIRWVKIGIWVAAGLFFLLIAAEIARLYMLAADIHPLLGYGLIVAMAAGSLVLAIPAYRFFKVPRAIKPPDNPPLEEMQISHIKSELRFLDKYLLNCARNPEFADKLEEIRSAREELQALGDKVSTADLATINEKLGQWSAEKMTAVLAEVDERAERVIYQEALAVGLATAASPNGMLDAFLMLWRSVNLASKLAVMYYGKPGPLGILAICRDVSLAVVSAAYLDRFSDSLGSVLTKTVGGIAGVVAGPAVEGVTNALVLIRIGYLTKERCRSFRHWNQTNRQSAVTRALSATQKVAVGLSTEIFRQVGVGIGAVAEATKTGITKTAGVAMNAATEIGQKISAVFTGKKPAESEPEQETTTEDAATTEDPTTSEDDEE